MAELIAAQAAIAAAGGGVPNDLAAAQALINNMRIVQRSRVLENARKATAGMPHYSRDRPWRTFAIEWRAWYDMNGIRDAGDDFGKYCLLTAMKGPAAEIASIIGRHSQVWADTAHFNDQPGPPVVPGYATKLKELFEPQAESELAKTTFKTAKQGPNEDRWNPPPGFSWQLAPAQLQPTVTKARGAKPYSRGGRGRGNNRGNRGGQGRAY